MTGSKKEKLIEQILIEDYNKYYSLAFSYVHNEADAMDIVQEGAYKAILNCETLKCEEYASSWIYRIMLNEIFGLLRKQKKIQTEDISSSETVIPAYDNNVSCADEIDLYNAMQELSSEERKILELRYFQDLKIDDMSKLLGMNVSTAKSKLYRTIDKLRVLMSI